MFYDLKDKNQKTLAKNWVAPNATIIGDVTLEKIQVFGLMQFLEEILKIFILVRGQMFKMEAYYIQILDVL